MVLKSLIVKEAELAEELIEKIVSPYCKYTETGKILPNDNFRKLTVKKKILVYLTAKSGLRFIFDDQNLDISADNSELEELFGVKGGTLRPRLKELRDGGFVITEKARHKISDHVANYIIEIFKLR